MRFLWYFLAVGATLFISSSLAGQQAGALVVQAPGHKKIWMGRDGFLPDVAAALKDTARLRPAFRLSPALVVETQGWFCNRELQVQKATRLPLYFRLGSKEYADRLEGKQGYLAR